MKIICSLLLFSVFSMLAGLHFYWALGGSWGFATTLPTDPSGKRLLNPSAFHSAFVGTFLLVFGWFYLLRSDLVSNFLPATLSNVAGWIIPIIFILRAIGDFRYIGFFKKVNQTPFAQADTLYYAPLCLVIGVLGLLLINLK